MPTEQELTDSLEEIAASGIKEVEYDGKKIVYRGQRDIDAQLNKLKCTRKRTSPLFSIHPAFDKGL